MSKELYLDLVKSSPQILRTLYADFAQPGVRQIGLALETVLSLSNTILLPVKLLNERCRVLFQKNIDDYRKRMKNVDHQNVADVPPEIGLPLLERFATTTDEDLSRLFVELLKSASCKTTQGIAHHSFVYRLDAMSPDEARIIVYLAEQRLVEFPYFVARMRSRAHPSTSVHTLTRFLTGLEKKVELTHPLNINLYLDNLCSLGIIDTDPTRELKNEFLIASLEQQYEGLFVEMQAKIDGMNEDEGVAAERAAELVIDKRFYFLTSYGRTFVAACTGVNQ